MSGRQVLNWLPGLNVCWGFEIAEQAGFEGPGGETGSPAWWSCQWVTAHTEPIGPKSSHLGPPWILSCLGQSHPSWAIFSQADCLHPHPSVLPQRTSSPGLTLARIHLSLPDSHHVWSEQMPGQLDHGPLSVDPPCPHFISLSQSTYSGIASDQGSQLQQKCVPSRSLPPEPSCSLDSYGLFLGWQDKMLNLSLSTSPTPVSFSNHFSP
jgi:hypothetical protein